MFFSARQLYVFCALLVLLAMNSCSPKPFYQVCKITSDQVTLNTNCLVYENDDCKLSYNFFCNGGNLGFSVKNKTDKMLYLVMPESFFIRNEIAHDYYSDATITNSVTNGGSITETTLGDKYYIGTVSRYTNISNGTQQTYSRSVAVREPKIVGVPPHAIKFIESFSIMNDRYVTCERKQDYPRKICSFDFSKSNSPVSFTNRIAYSFDSDGSKLIYIANDFYISNITNYSPKMARKKGKETDCLGMERSHHYFTFGDPDLFYIRYQQPKDYDYE